MIFRAVGKDHKDAEGRMLAHELIKEVVPIEGGDGKEGGGGGEAGGNRKAKAVEREVIEID